MAWQALSFICFRGVVCTRSCEVEADSGADLTSAASYVLCFGTPIRSRCLSFAVTVPHVYPHVHSWQPIVFNVNLCLDCLASLREARLTSCPLLRRMFFAHTYQTRIDACLASVRKQHAHH